MTYTMRRGFATTGLVATLLLTGQTPAFADDDLQTGGDIVEEDTDEDGGFELGAEVIHAVPAGSLEGQSSPSHVWIAVPTMSSSGNPEDGNQGACRGVEFVQVEPAEAAEVRQRAEADYYYNWGNIPDLMGLDPNVPCPVEPGDDVPAALVEDSVRAVVRGQLPRPTLELPPGFALAGLRTYLVTDHQLTHDLNTTLDLQVINLDVSITATGTSVVDWGDGTVTEYDHGADQGYPDGPINHVYTDAGFVDITVSDTWTVTYEAGPISGSFEAPLADVVLPDIEVTERRAVRTG